MNILFVCSGNVSRSFLAAMLLKNEVRKHGLYHISIASAGVSAYNGNPPDPHMVKYLSQMEIPAEDHESRQITKEDVDWADLILVMEKDHQMRIEGKWPEAKEKLEFMGSYVSEDPVADDIIDPYGGSSYHYRLAQSQISLAVRSLVKRLLQEQG
ncbi:MAG: low molecular weight phosphotyrosine protein phosphatase [Deltaproteobacteria bacterium]|nr:low molecular weight phosphotyrosine protein phosphatase [Deltaproteobacteria bacterium]